MIGYWFIWRNNVHQTVVMKIFFYLVMPVSDLPQLVDGLPAIVVVDPREAK